MAAPDPQTSIPNRREFKYLVPKRRIPELRDRISGYCTPDAFAGDDGSYRIRSLYLDTWNMRLYKANDREAPERFKARVRSYPDAPGGPVFAEIKARVGDVIRKGRAKLPDEGWSDMVRGGPSGRYASPPLDDFICRVHRFGLRPICQVESSREAWMSRTETYARVSIDSRVECRPERRWTLEARGRRCPVDHPLQTHTKDSVCVVELKWADAAPRWMVALVQHLQILRHSYSKYGFSVLSLAEEHQVDYRRTQSVWV